MSIRDEQKKDGKTADDERNEFARLLDMWGGSPSRWPDGARARILQLSNRVPEAAVLLGEARALDAALDAASTAAEEHGPDKRNPRLMALSDRIMTAAMASSPRPAASRGATTGEPQRDTDAIVIAIDKGKRQSGPSRRATLPLRSLPRWQQASALIAASLLAGILIGGSFDFAPVVRDVAGGSGAMTELEAAALLFDVEPGSEEAL